MRFIGVLLATVMLAFGVAAPAAAAGEFVLSQPSGALPAATLGQPYAWSISATGGTGGAPKWSVVGSLPPGLSISKNIGSGTTKITGTPTRTGTYTFTLQAKNKSGQIAQARYSITVQL